MGYKYDSAHDERHVKDFDKNNPTIFVGIF
jgi:hypothetical protein